MALVWIDGFDKYGTTPGALCSPTGIMRTRYHQRQDRAYTFTGRYGGMAIGVAYDKNAWIQTPHLTTNSTLIIGFSLYVPSTHTAHEMFQLRSETNYYDINDGGISVWINADESLTIKRGTTTLGTSAALVITENSWHSFELKLVTNDSTGSYEIRIDDTDVLSDSGVDTRQGSDDYHSVVRFTGGGGTVAAYVCRFDDFWVCDGTGSVNNDFLGSEMRVATISPNADGDDSDWDEVPPGNHYSSVNEAEQDDTKYIEDAAVTHLDLFAYESMPSVGAIKGVLAVTECKSTEPDEWTLKSVVKHSTTEDADSGQVVGTDDWKCLCRMMEENPVTATAWTESDINNLQAGVEVG